MNKTGTTFLKDPVLGFFLPPNVLTQYSEQSHILMKPLHLELQCQHSGQCRLSVACGYGQQQKPQNEVGHPGNKGIPPSCSASQL